MNWREQGAQVRAYQLSGGNELDPAKLKAADESTERQVKKAEAYFRVLQGVPEVDHFTTSAWLLANPGVFSGEAPEVASTLSRAEALFKALNALRKS